MNNNKTTFWKFLEKNTIEIPIIQRDYAQGRLGKENLRKSFLGDLKTALDSGEIMKLDFVYGSTENDKLNPLDGQQRLTTLWLLHWYIALRAEELNETTCDIFKNFTYETRISSREFCENLCKPEYFKTFDGYDIVDFITKQTWFYSAWKQDPTIQSMLRMLGGTKITNKKKEDIIDGIEELFSCDSLYPIGKEKCTFKGIFVGYWEKLISDNAPIVFYHLPLRDFGLSDDLYIKMNARGKQLTSFENFKADLIGYITNESLEKSKQKDWEELLDTTKGIPIMLDTKWTDIFWKNKSIGIKDKESKLRKSNQIDEIYFAFLNRFFWNELFIARNSENKYILDIGKGDESSTQENNNSSYKYLNNSEYENDTTIAYEGLDVYRYCEKTIPLSFFQKIKKILNNYFTYSQVNDLPECPWDKSFRFIPEYIEEKDNNIEIENTAKEKILKVTTLNQVQRVVFFAVCKYFDHGDDVKDSESSLKQWMRVVWNLVSGEDHSGRPEIRSTSVMRTAVEFIDSLNSHNVYDSLVKQNVLGNSSFDERCKEEIVKAKQILNGGLRPNKETWEKIIIEAETYEFFKGAIRFLFTDGEGNINWCNFDTKWTNAQRYFPKNSPEKYKNTVECAKYFNDKEIKKLWWNYTFDIKDKAWRMLLLSKYHKQIHAFMLEAQVNNTVLVEDIKNLSEKIKISLWIRTWDTNYCFLTNYDKQVAKPEKGYVYMVGSRRRNKAIKEIINIAEDIKFQGGSAESSCEVISNLCYYRGLNVDFKYDSKCFRLWKNNTICLMNDNWEDKIFKGPDSPNVEKDSYYFDINDEATDIKERLDKLINRL